MKTIQEYWDAEMDGRVTWHKNAYVINDNWVKRKNIVSEILKHVLWKKDVLEIGCGVATLGAIMKLTCGCHYKGLDVSPKAVEMSKMAWGLDIEEGKTNAMPFDKNSQDVIIALDVLEHIHPNERIDTYYEIARVLRPNGKMMINNP